MTQYKNGINARVGDVVKFMHEGEVHLGKIIKIHADSKADLSNVRHIPTAVERGIDISTIDLAASRLVHRYEEK